jgi:hypothetical protein
LAAPIAAFPSALEHRFMRLPCDFCELPSTAYCSVPISPIGAHHVSF